MMTLGDEDVRTLLDAVAEHADVLRVTRADVERAVRRRRTAHAFYAAAAVAAVAVVGGLAVPLSLSGGRPDASGPGAAASAEPTAVQVHAIACGAPISPPTVGTAAPGLRLTVTNIARDVAGHPTAATVTLTATAEIRVGLPGRTPLQVLLLRDNVVVERLATYGIAAGDHVTDWIASGPDGAGGPGAASHSLLVSPMIPWVVRVGGPGHCRPTFASAGGYSLVAVMSIPRSAEWPGSADPQDPLLLSDPVPLSGG